MLNCFVNCLVIQCPPIKRHFLLPWVISPAELWGFSVGVRGGPTPLGGNPGYQSRTGEPELVLILFGFLQFSHFKIFRNI